jgi:hypothetical protein
LVEDVGDELRKADEVEQRVIDEVRRLGQEVLEAGSTSKSADARKPWIEPQGSGARKKNASSVLAFLHLGFAAWV